MNLCTSLCYHLACCSVVFVFVLHCATINMFNLVDSDRVRSTTCFPVHSYPLGPCSKSSSRRSPYSWPTAFLLSLFIVSWMFSFEDQPWLLHGQYTYACGNGISRPVVCLFCSPPGCRRRRRHFPSFGYPSAYYSTVMTCTMHTQIMYYYNEE